MNTPERWKAIVNSEGELEGDPELCDGPDADGPDVDVSVGTYGESHIGFGPSPEAAEADAKRRYDRSQDPPDSG